jgi:lipoprotein-releasing system ATP-binding protein
MNEIRSTQVADGQSTEPMIRIDGVVRTFKQAGQPLTVLRGASLEVKGGELVALVGPSGAGKSTLLHIAGLLEKADGGDIRIAGKLANTLSDADRTALRRQSVGFVYQFHHLLPEFSALENIVLPQMIAGVAKPAARKRGMELLEMVGLGARASHRPARLSGGEQQRVAIARALANRPKLLIADEPTGNLDQKTAEGVFAMLADLVRGGDFGALVATHNLDLAARMDRVLELRDGVLVQH